MTGDQREGVTPPKWFFRAKVRRLLALGTLAACVLLAALSWIAVMLGKPEGAKVLELSIQGAWGAFMFILGSYFEDNDGKATADNPPEGQS